MARYCCSADVLELMKSSITTCCTSEPTIKSEEQVRKWKKQTIFIRWTLLHFNPKLTDSVAMEAIFLLIEIVVRPSNAWGLFPPRSAANSQLCI